MVSPPSPGARTCPRLLSLGRLRPERRQRRHRLGRRIRGSAQSGSLAHAARRPAPRQIRVLRSADNTGHSGQIALDSVANAPGVFNCVGWVAGAGQPGQNNPAELFVVVLGVLDRWRLPNGPSAAPTWRRTSDPRLWATYWAARSGGAVGCAGTGSGWVPVGGTRGPPFRFRTRACSALGRSSR